MAVTKRNVLVGAGNLFIAATDGATPALPTPGAGVSMVTALEADVNWRSVGATQEGVEVAFEPDYGEVEVDQMKDAIIMFNQGVTVSMSTNLAEATLQNLLVAWGFPSTNLTTDTFKLSVPGDDPVERSAVVVGRAPATAGGLKRERYYHARRVISVEGSNHSLRRTEATVFPVNFRLLPDPAFAGAEYGVIVDRTI